MEKKNIEEDLEILHQSLKKFLSDDESIIKITLKYQKKKRQELKKEYKELFDSDLENDISKKLNGKFKKTILGLWDIPSDFDARNLYKSIRKIGTNQETLIEIICTRSNSELKLIKESYLKLFNEDLEKQLNQVLNGNLQKLLLTLLKCQRNENTNIDQNITKKKAEDLYNLGKGKWEDNEDYINKLFCSLSPNEFISFSNFFYQFAKNSLRKEIEKEITGNYQQALLTIYDGIICPSEFFARKINRAVKGIGTKDKMLIRILVYREEIDIHQIRIIYKNLIGKELADDIKGDTHGSYRKVLMEIANKKN